jgi:hypothetical protein
VLTFRKHESFVVDLLAKIPAEAEKLLRSPKFRNKERVCWNKAVIEALYAAKEEPEYKEIISFYGIRPGCHEWLLDAVLYEEGCEEEEGVLKGVLVGVESELGSNLDGIKFDFMRLLSIKAPLKILIVGIERRRIRALKNKIEECARGFEQHQPGEAYYLINFIAGGHDVYRYKTGRSCPNGRAPAFTFRHLSGLSGDDA